MLILNLLQYLFCNPWYIRSFILILPLLTFLPFTCNCPWKRMNLNVDNMSDKNADQYKTFTQILNQFNLQQFFNSLVFQWKFLMTVVFFSLQRHFCVFTMNFPNNEALTTIYTSILSQHLQQARFSNPVQKCVPMLISAALTLHARITSTFLPTAIKFHYVFNLRDLSNIFQVSW